ncbi:NlpC/P60 family protein [Streptomyces sp. NPDC026665]|uniref:C40 family peptidase n=1 Tax=Streptomyces sp. NPDC026665 TaxID=3154798 RepID=UPI0033CD43EA
MRSELDDLYHDAEVATDTYNAASEKAEQQSRHIKKLKRSIGQVEKRLSKLNSKAGAAARAQYRSGGLPAEFHVVLSNRPQEALDGAAQVLQAQANTAMVVQHVQETRSALHTKVDEATQELHELRESNAKKRKAQRKIERRIAMAQRLENELEPAENKALLRQQASDYGRAENDWLASGGGADDKESPAGRKAVSYASRQLGKPYIWGAEGPNSFDCSGLTSQAWIAAGHPIPRTSQEQWRQLTRVKLKNIRPGDLVIYFTDASHVGIYIGNGYIIHAPRPGRTISTAPISSMKILGVVRPDA